MKRIRNIFNKGSISLDRVKIFDIDGGYYEK